MSRCPTVQHHEFDVRVNRRGGAATVIQVAGSVKSMSTEDIEGKLNEAAGFLKPAEKRSIPEQIHHFREEFAKLLEEAKIDQLVVLIDDLDHCLPATAIETLEAIRLFLFVPKTAFVIGADEGMIEYAVRQHFPNLPLTTGTIPYTRTYLEKLIQVPFRYRRSVCGNRAPMSRCCSSRS